MIRLVFEKFEELGSAYAVFRYLVVNSLQLGFRRHRGRACWRTGVETAIAHTDTFDLATSFYAGAYAYGMDRAGSRNPVTGRTEGGKLVVPPRVAVLLQIGYPSTFPGIDIWRIRNASNRIAPPPATGRRSGVPLCFLAWLFAGNAIVA